MVPWYFSLWFFCEADIKSILPLSFLTPLYGLVLNLGVVSIIVGYKKYTYTNNFKMGINPTFDTGYLSFICQELIFLFFFLLSGFWWISGKLLLSTDHWRRTDLSVNRRLHWYHPEEGIILGWHLVKCSKMTIQQCKSLNVCKLQFFPLMKSVWSSVLMLFNFIFKYHKLFQFNLSSCFRKISRLLTTVVRLNTKCLGFAFPSGRWTAGYECISIEQTKVVLSTVDFKLWIKMVS